MTTYITLFVSSFLTVFLLVTQQKNVSGNHYIAAAITSFAIGASQIYLWLTLPGADSAQIVATLLGGPVGVTVAMWLHPKILKRRNGTKLTGAQHNEHGKFNAD